MNAATVSTQVLDALHDLIFIYRGRMRAEMHRHDDRLNRNSVRCLLFVGHQPLSTHKELTDYLRADKALVARVLTDMEENGWIERVPHPDDRRSRRLQLSEQGKSLFAEMQKARAKIGEQMMQGCPEALQKQLAAQLLQMQANLRASDEAGKSDASSCEKRENRRCADGK